MSYMFSILQYIFYRKRNIKRKLQERINPAKETTKLKEKRNEIKHIQKREQKKGKTQEPQNLQGIPPQQNTRDNACLASN